MAHSALSEADCKEFFDDPQTLQTKIRKLAALIRGSKHFCAYTGAGVSTAAGIADFRSGLDTSLDTGAGCWTRKAAVKKGKSSQIKQAKRKTKPIKAIPSKAHMALVALMTTGPKYLKHLASTNCDGLHRRSGIPPDQLSELHGNGTLEVCNKCSRGYLRDYKTKRKAKSIKDKRTGRKCTISKCRGDLCRTVVNFKETLPEKTWTRAEGHTNRADVMLALGSSLTVMPAAALCIKAASEPFNADAFSADGMPIWNAPAKKNLVIVNLQKTPLDYMCYLRIFAKIDDVMVGLMRELELEIPEWRVRRFLKLSVAPQSTGDKRTLQVSAMDSDGVVATVFKDVKMRNNGQPLVEINKPVARGPRKKFQEQNVFTFEIPASLEMKNAEEEDQIQNQSRDQEADLSLEDVQEEADPEALQSPVHKRPKDDTSESPNSTSAQNAEPEDCKVNGTDDKEQQIEELMQSGFSREEAEEAIAISVGKDVDADADEDEKDDAADSEVHGTGDVDPNCGLTMSLGFFGHYGEPRLRMQLNELLGGIGQEGGDVVCRLQMDVSTKQWTFQKINFEPLPTVKEIYSFTKK